jgi:hypothetical protein
MRRVFLLAVIGSLLWRPAAAQMLDEIGLFVDAAYENCMLVDSSPGPVTVYVVHRVKGGRGSSQFMVQADAGVGFSYLGEQPQYDLVIGDSQNGVTVAYGECLYSDVLVMTISYFATGSSSTCSTLRVVADPRSLSNSIEVVSCTLDRLEASGSRLVVNPDGSCECGPNTVSSDWGRIKSKYGD